MKKFTMMVVVMILALSLTACNKDDATETTGAENATVGTDEKDTIKIGMFGPYTGENSVYGMATKNAAAMAVDEINADGGINGKKIELITYDTKGDNQEALNAYNKLVDNDKVDSIIGGVTSGPTITVATASVANNTPMITPTATAAEVTTSADNMFRVCFIDEVQARSVAKLSIEELEGKTASVLYNSSSEYSEGLTKNFVDEFEKSGGTVIDELAYGDGDKDFNTQLTEIKLNEPDILFIPDYYNTVALVINQAKAKGIESILVGPDGWDGLYGQVDDKALLENAYFIAHYSVDDDNEKVQTFIKNYEEKYDAIPNSFAALGYDAAYILAEAIKNADKIDNESIIAELRKIEFDGITGNIRFDDIGNPIKDITVNTFKDGKTAMFKKIDMD